MRAPLAAIAALTLAAAACGAATPSKELVNARQAYNTASTSRAAEYTPASVLSARQALQRAEREHKEDPGSDLERSYAYVAQRRAELAMTEGDAAWERAQRQRSEAELARLQQENSDRTQAELQASQERVQTLEQQKAELEALGRVKEDQRGTVLTLSGQVLFATGKSELLPASRQSLTKLAEMVSSGDRHLTIEGYTDSRGSTESNRRLSMERAEAVRDFLVQQGVPPDRLTAVGMGEDQPVASNDTAEGRANNRRVEIVFGRGGMTPAGGRTPSQTTPSQTTPSQTPQTTPSQPSPMTPSPAKPEKHHQR
jgi:outer membrane protein OmpA-like peptidoglycan-associated protein